MFELKTNRIVDIFIHAIIPVIELYRIAYIIKNGTAPVISEPVRNIQAIVLGTNYTTWIIYWLSNTLISFW